MQLQVKLGNCLCKCNYHSFFRNSHTTVTYTMSALTDHVLQPSVSNDEAARSSLQLLFRYHQGAF